MSDADRNEVHQRFAVDAAIKQAVRETLAEHGRLGQRVVVWRDDRPVWVLPEEGRPEPTE